MFINVMFDYFLALSFTHGSFLLFMEVFGYFMYKGLKVALRALHWQTPRLPKEVLQPSAKFRDLPQTFRKLCDLRI